MSVYALERDKLSTSNQSAEIHSLQLPREVHLDPRVGIDSQLAGTGWHSRKELIRLAANYNQLCKEGKTHQEALMLSAAETERNIRTYIVEYVQSNTILPHLNRLEWVDGRMRMVGKNGVSVVSGITVDERNGAVLQASQKAEDFLTDAGTYSVPRRVAVINSPLGHSGLINEHGKVINYKNNQTMVFWTDEAGELHGLTIVSDLNRKQSRQLSTALEVDEKLSEGATETEQVAAIVGNPALFSYGRSISNPAKYVFEKILAIRGNSDIKLEQEDGSIEIRSVAQTWEDIEKFGSLLEFKPLWEKQLNEWRQKILAKGSKLNHPIIQAEIVRDIEETILDITVDYLQQAKLPKYIIPQDHVIYFQSAVKSGQQDFNIPPIPTDKYVMAKAFLRTRAGCAGGGGNSAALRGVSLGLSAESSTAVTEGGSGICKECKQSNLDNHYHCPDCNKKYADETNTERTAICACGFEFGCGNSVNKEKEKQDEDSDEDSKVVIFPAPKEAAKAA